MSGDAQPERTLVVGATVASPSHRRANCRGRCRSRGSVLLVVMFTLAVVSLLASSYAYRAATEYRLARQAGVLAQLRAQADSASAIAIARLVDNTNEFDHLAEPWHTHDPLAAENWLPEWSGTSAASGGPAFVAEYQVIDEESKLNVMRASGDALKKLGMSPEQIASLLDWVDADDATGSGGGAETDYYASLPHPYRAKNARMDSLDELLLVRGFGKADYLGQSAALDDRVLRPPADELRGDARLGWVDLLTCVGDGHLNINTAPLAVLQTLPLAEGSAERIVAFRAFRGTGTESLEKYAFTSADDVSKLQGLTPADVDVLQQVAVFKSQHFRIITSALHTSSGLRVQTETLVRAHDGKVEVIMRNPKL